MSIKHAFQWSFLAKNKHKRAIGLVIAAVDSVHSTPHIPPIEIFVSGNAKENGCYHRVGGTGEPRAIELSRRGETMEFTLTHEIGHFLEAAAIPGSFFGVRPWASDLLTLDWQRTILGSEEIHRLRRIEENGLVEFMSSDGVRVSRPIDPKLVIYYLSFQELWARSYAQYVAIRSGNETLLSQLAARRSPRAVYPLQWNDGQFEPIAAAMDHVFAEIGWRP